MAIIVEIIIEFLGEIVVELLWYSIYEPIRSVLMKCRKNWNTKVLKILCGILTILFWGCILFLGSKILEIVLP